MGQLPTGVTVVTTLDGERPLGITVNALASVEPRAADARRSRSTVGRFIVPSLDAAGRFAVNILDEAQQDLSDCFAGSDVTPGRDAFCGAPWHPGRDRPAAPRRRDRVARVHDRAAGPGRRPLPVHRPGRRERRRGPGRPPAALPPAPLPADRAVDDGDRRRQARVPGRLSPDPMPTIAANGLEIAYTVDGAGPPLVLLHGASSSGEADFGRVLPALRGGFRCHVPDARGHGGTRWDAADGFRYEWLVEDVLAFVDALGLATFHLLGFSMGGATALGFAARYPERLRTLVLVGITPEREPRSVGRPPAVRRRRGSRPTTRSGPPSCPRATTRSRVPAPGSGCCPRSPGTSRRRSSTGRPTSSGSTARCCSPWAIATRSSRPTRRGGSSGSSPTRGCSSRPTAATRSCSAGRPSRSRRSPGSIVRPRRSRRARAEAVPGAARPARAAAAPRSSAHLGADEPPGEVTPDTDWLKEATR